MVQTSVVRQIVVNIFSDIFENGLVSVLINVIC